jgi:hypothetical protein
MIDYRICRRCPPFGEHRSMREVIETEDLLERQARGDNMSAYGARLQSLLSRAIVPTYAVAPEREPPGAA